MKKVSTLLLTGLLGTGMVFASFSGTATLTNTLIDFSNNEFGFKNPAPELDATIDIAVSTAEMVGEGDIYAEINASLNIPVTIDEADDGTTPAVYAAIADEITIAFDSANVVGDGWMVSILGPNGPVDYAADTIALDDDDDAYNYSVDGSTVAGVAVTLDDFGTVSLGYYGDFDDLTTTTGYVSFEAAEMEVADGVTAQVAAGLYVDKALTNNIEASGSAKVAYASDDLSASVAADLGYDDTNNFGADVVANIMISPLTIDAYFGTVNTNSEFTFAETSIAPATANLLNVKAVADLNDYDVPVTLTLTGLDLVNVQDLSAQVDVTLSDELSVYVSGGYTLVGGAWNVGAGATYAVDEYTAAADVSYDGADFGASASIETTTLVDGATLALEWDGATDLLDSTTPVLGSVIASCTMEF